MQVEIESAEALETHLSEVGHLKKVVVQGLDLEPLSDRLLRVSGAGAVFLGCRIAAPVAEHLRASGAVLFPALADRPYRPYRPTLYSPEELMEGYEEGRPASFWESSRDARIYDRYVAFRESDPPPILEALAQRLHDHAIDDAKHELLRGRRPVAVMGGHAMARTEPAFREVARIAWRLARRGYFLVSGGGPGAMEACNLGAWLSPHDEPALDDALSVLAEAPGYRDPGWFDTALEVKRRYPGGAESLAIPTWFYGHEPTNLFATHAAKYFSNSLREDGLLAIATHGVIYAPGSAGTIQEVFMDAAQNHYGTFRLVSPMVFLGREYWRTERPVAPVLERLSAGRQYERLIGWCDDADEVVTFLVDHPPVPYEGGS